MLENFNLNSIFFLMGLTGLVPLVLAWKVWQIGRSAEIRYFVFVLASCAIYSIFYTLKLSAADLSLKVLFLKLQYIGAVLLGPFMLLFILSYSGKNFMNLKYLKMIFIYPLIGLFMVFSNDIHFLFYGSYNLVDSGVFEVLQTEKKIFYWLHQLYTVTLLIIGQAIIIQMIKNETVSGKKQVKLVWFGMSLPLLAYAIHLAGIVPLNLDPIPVSFVGAGLFVFLGLTKYRLFKEAPIVYKALFESISEAVLVSDREGNLVTCNPAASEFLSPKKGGLEKANRSNTNSWHQLKEILKISQKDEGNVFSWFQSKKLHWYSASLSPIFDSKKNPLGDIIVLRDVTSEKDYQHKLELAKEEADKANRAKSEFLANISHEIRTPLNGVIGFTELLGNTPLTDQQKRYVSTASNSANALLELINNVLDLSKIEAGKVELDFQEVNLPQLLRTISDVMSFQANKFGIEFLINVPANVPVLVLTDELKIKQILINLLNNALKFTKEGEVELSVEVMGRPINRKALLRFQVKDSGIGIEPEKQMLIFEAFSQADSSTTKQYGGTGLGLTISNKLLALLGSRLHVESVLDEGSTFYFDVLVEDLSPAIQREKPYIELTSALLIGFTPKLAKNAALYLDQLGVDIRSCDGLSEAKELLQRIPDIKLILLNQNLSDLETAYPKLRDFVIWGKSKRIIPYFMLLPASVPEEILVRFDTLGYTKRIIKPLMLDNLTNAISRLGEVGLEEKPESQNDTKSDEFHKIKVLVAEDNSVNRMLIRVYLTNIYPGIVVLEADTGKKAFQLFTSENPHLVISDIQMPEMSGYDLAIAIRHHPWGKDLGMIALTANIGNGEEEKCKEMGFNDYISKPVRQDTFKKVVDKWLKN